MVSIAYYRGEAERCHRLAEKASDAEVASQWRKLARDYNALADSLAASEASPLPPIHVPMQQQPLQQQQAKSEPDDKK